MLMGIIAFGVVLTSIHAPSPDRLEDVHKSANPSGSRGGG
jgi:hypothetical protein